MGSIPIALRGHNPVEWLSEIAFVFVLLFQGTISGCLFVCLHFLVASMFIHGTKAEKTERDTLKSRNDSSY